MVMRALLLGLVLLTGCVMPESFKAPPPPPPPPPLTLPLPDGRAADLQVEGDNYHYIVNYQALDQARLKVFLRVARASAPELTYSDGLLAKKVAEAYCAQYNRHLNPVAYGLFSTPGAWMFEGGCT
jgi:hypothetical protein